MAISGDARARGDETDARAAFHARAARDDVGERGAVVAAGPAVLGVGGRAAADIRSCVGRAVHGTGVRLRAAGSNSGIATRAAGGKAARSRGALAARAAAARSAATAAAAQAHATRSCAAVRPQSSSKTLTGRDDANQHEHQREAHASRNHEATTRHIHSSDAVD